MKVWVVQNLLSPHDLSVFRSQKSALNNLKGRYPEDKYKWEKPFNQGITVKHKDTGETDEFLVRQEDVLE